MHKEEVGAIIRSNLPVVKKRETRGAGSRAPRTPSARIKAAMTYSSICALLRLSQTTPAVLSSSSLVFPIPRYLL